MTKAIELTPDTERLVQVLFAQEHHASVLALLRTQCGAGVHFGPSPTPESMERLRFAVLKLSEGSMEKLARALEVANIDWRDVLVAAGFGHDALIHRRWLSEQIAARGR
jgi:hypothetical protein